MIIYIGADHRGFELKERIKKYLSDKNYKVEDVGNHYYDESDDYPDFAIKVAENISKSPNHNAGIVICGSGVGVDIVANKFIGVRSALAANEDQIIAARKDDDVNVLALAAEFISEEDAQKIVDLFLETKFDEEDRHERRLEKIEEMENK